MTPGLNYFGIGWTRWSVFLHHYDPRSNRTCLPLHGQVLCWIEMKNEAVHVIVWIILPLLDFGIFGMGSILLWFTWSEWNRGETMPITNMAGTTFWSIFEIAWQLFFLISVSTLSGVLLLDRACYPGCCSEVHSLVTYRWCVMPPPQARFHNDASAG